jgi:xylulokinase
MGIDIGTTATKIILIDLAGHVVASVKKPSTLLSQHTSWAEEDANHWWDNVCKGIPECIQQAGVQSSQIAAVGTSGMMPTIVLLDKDGRVLRNSIQQNDARAVDEIEYLRSKTDATDILRRTGSGITQQTIGTKILWLRRHEPYVLEKAVHLMGSYEFIAHRLTGVFYIERNWALESGYFDLYQEDWDDEILKLSTINRTLLGPVHWPYEVIGAVTKEASRLTGLKEGTPVVAGSADHIASSFSSGLKNRGDLLVKLGGAGDIMVSLDKIIVDERLFLDYNNIPGKYIASGCMATSGSLIKWFRNQFAPEASYSDLDDNAKNLPAGSDGLIVLPYFLGEKTPIHDPLARGTLVGLTLTHTSAHVYRAILEGISYGFYHHLTVFAEHGIKPSYARCANGGARSALWKQITADVLGIRLEQIVDHPGSSLGAAFCAGMGVGAFTHWDEIERYITISTITVPDMENHTRYSKLFNLYLEIYESLKNKFPRLVDIAHQAQSKNGDSN